MVEYASLLAVARSAVIWAVLDLRSLRQRLMWVAMAGETIAHAQGHLPGHHFHCLHFAVTRLTGDSCTDMGSMVEEDVVRQSVNALPLEWPARFVDLS
jgi:hypothetical protein